MFRFSSVNSTMVETNHRWGLLLLQPSLWKASNWKCVFPIGLIQWDVSRTPASDWPNSSGWGGEFTSPDAMAPLYCLIILELESSVAVTCGHWFDASTQFLNNDHLLHKAHGQSSNLTAKWPVCTQTPSMFVIPLTQSGVHQGQGQTVFSPISLPCPQTTGHNSSLSSTTSLLSGLPLQVPADNLLKPCCIFFSICLVFHLHWQMQKLCCPRPWGRPLLAICMPYSENSLPLTQFPWLQNSTTACMYHDTVAIKANKLREP